MDIKELKEKISELEHEQWMYWSKELGRELNKIKHAIELDNKKEALDRIKLRIKRWQEMWKPYNKLEEDIKNYDRIWADKIIHLLRSNR